eukprot:24938_6
MHSFENRVITYGHSCLGFRNIGALHRTNRARLHIPSTFWKPRFSGLRSNK